jgi:hypothetical protein
MVDEATYDRWTYHFPDGIRARIIRVVMDRTCEAIEEEGSINLNDLLRGNIKVIEYESADI